MPIARGACFSSSGREPTFVTRRFEGKQSSHHRLIPRPFRQFGSDRARQIAASSPAGHATSLTSMGFSPDRPADFAGNFHARMPTRVGKRKPAAPAARDLSCLRKHGSPLQEPARIADVGAQRGSVRCFSPWIPMPGTSPERCSQILIVWQSRKLFICE